ncbi:MAG: flagellar M-ring protein FliF, partial [Photobacterium halotolerans]
MTMITQAAAAELTAANRSDNSLLERAKRAWYSSQRNLVLSAALAAVVAAIIVVALWTSTQSYRPLYSQQERFDTSEIISVLEAEGIPYRLQETNGQVLVEDGRVAEVRMLLAAKGVKAKLPTGL